jgi:hypothetical protein
VRNRLGNKDEEDLSKQILKARLNRFGGEVSKSKNPVSVVKRLTLTTGGGVKSRLGGGAAAILAKECKNAANQASKASVKKRLGEQARCVFLQKCASKALEHAIIHCSMNFK